MGEEDNKSKNEVVVPQEVSKEQGQITNPRGAGRKSVEENPLLQREYHQMYYLRAVMRWSVDKVANAFDKSPATVKIACKYARSQMENLDTSDAIKDVEAICDAEITKCDKEVTLLEKQGNIIIFPNSNISVKIAEKDADGKDILVDKIASVPVMEKDTDGNDVVARRTDKNQINIVKRRKMDYQRMLFDAKGFSVKNQIFLSKNTFVGNNGNVNSDNNGKLPLIIDIMTEEDRKTFLGLLEKYGRIPLITSD